MKPHLRPITGQDLSALTNALRVAKEVYEGHAKEFAQSAQALRENPPAPATEGDGETFDIMPQNPVAFDRMAQQFTHQAEDVARLMAALDGPEGCDDYLGEVDLCITYTPDEEDARQGPWARP